MKKIAVIGAPSSIGIGPYDDDREARHLDRAPGVLEQTLGDGGRNGEARTATADAV